MKKKSRFNKIAKQFPAFDRTFINPISYELHSEFKNLNLTVFLVSIISFLLLCIFEYFSINIILKFIVFLLSISSMIYISIILGNNDSNFKIKSIKNFYKYHYKIANNFSLNEVEKIYYIFYILKEYKLPITDNNIAKLFNIDLDNDNIKIEQIKSKISEKKEYISALTKDINELEKQINIIKKENIKLFLTK